MKIRPVRLLSRVGDPKPTGAGAKAQTQLEAAQRIWGKCCINLEILEPYCHVDPDLKISGDPELVVRALSDPDENTIEVFFVDHRLKKYGGGATLSCGCNTASVVLTEYSDYNDNLLAHELGHVFAGVHPNPPIPSTFFWEGDTDSVLEPILHINEANPDLNTLSNCRRADNPALTTVSPQLCRLHPDK